jgi:hypothetical protein
MCAILSDQPTTPVTNRGMTNKFHIVKKLSSKNK